ncbi:ATP-binding protein [Marimonas lutisalis]|uniref:ATP-binding protein n=1 Tax=Marimonas lutisalis TaxID=2545756 RepID=UPI0010F69BFB|nr:ATP-binding protein [Marimonas lutisalis]
MHTRIRQKWRPPLALVVACTLVAVLSLPLIGLGLLRWWAPILGWGQAAALIAAGVLAATGGIGFVLWRVLLRPVTALADRARALKSGAPHGLDPLEHYGTAEFRDLGQAMLDMGATLQNRETGIRAFSDHVTHEMKSPLTSISAAAELLDGPLDESDRAPLVESIRTSAARMNDLLGALRRLAAARTPLGPGPADLADVADALRDQSGLTITVKDTGQVPLGRAGLLAVLEQLAQNAEGHGAQSLTLHYSAQSLHVQDDGPGIPEGDRSRVFQPFFTTRRAQGGTGMGLAIVQTMLAASGGSIALMPSESGTHFIIRF